MTVMGEKGAPTPVAWTRLRAPESLMAPSTPESMQATVAASPRQAKYAEVVDRESAREILAKKLEEGAKAEAEAAEKAEKAAKSGQSGKTGKPAARSKKKDDGGIVQDVVQSGAFKQFMRTAAAEIARGMFGTARRRR